MGQGKHIGTIRLQDVIRHANGDVSVEYEGPIPTMVGALKRGGVKVGGYFDPYMPGAFDAREANVAGARIWGSDIGEEFAEERAANASMVRVLFDPYSSERDEKGRIRFVEGNDSNAAALYENSRRNNATITILVAQGLMKQGVPVMQAIGLAMRALQHAASEDLVKEGDETPASWSKPDEAWFVPRQATDGCNEKRAPLMSPQDVEDRLRSYVRMRNTFTELEATRRAIVAAKEEDADGEPVRSFHIESTGGGGNDPFDMRRFERIGIGNHEVIDLLKATETRLFNELLDMGVDANRI